MMYTRSPIFYIVITTLILSACSSEKVKPKVDYTIEDSNIPMQESWNSEIIFSEDGSIKAKLFSDHIRIYNEPREKLLTTVIIDFYNSQGQPRSKLTSEKGRIDDITQNMYAIENVVAINDSSGVRLETDELMWRKEDGKIVTDKFVRITTDDEIIEGYGFESDQSLQNYIIYDITYQTTMKNTNQ
jgi:LPS export ABC transporter protein LptC